MAQRGTLVVVSGPSGVGKTSLARKVAQLRPDLVLSVSVTTRRPRPGERDGLDYRFVSGAEFERLDAAGAFLETAEVYGERYGTLRSAVDQPLAEGRTVILEIDVQGAASVRRSVPDALLVFVEPPSRGALEDRLRGRMTEDGGSIERRLDAADEEMAAKSWFDRSLENAELEKAALDLIRILEDATSEGSKET